MATLFADPEILSRQCETVSSLGTSHDLTRDRLLHDLATECLMLITTSDEFLTEQTIELLCQEEYGRNCSITAEGKLELGLPLLRELDSASLRFASYLLSNLHFQIAPIAGPPPKLAAVFDPDECVDKALRLYSPNWMDSALSAHGFSRSTIQSLMEAIGATRSSPAIGTHSAIDSLMRFPKPPLEHRLFFRTMFDIDTAIEGYSNPDERAFRARIHNQLFCDSVLFVIAHECAHIILANTKDRVQATSYEEELAADGLALQIMRDVDGFRYRSLFSLFGFLQQYDTPDQEGSHPFSRHRLLNLSKAVVRGNADTSMRQDLNAGLMQLETPVGQIEKLVEWPNHQVETVKIHAFQSPDLDHAVNLRFYIDRPWLTDRTIGREFDLLFESLAVRARVVVHDIMNSSQKISEPTVYLKPITSDKQNTGQPIGITAERTAIGVARARIELSPSWWLDNPTVAVSVEDIDDAGNMEVDSCVLLEMNDSETSHTMPDGKDVVGLDDRLLMALRRLLRFGEFDRAIPLFDTLWRDCPKILDASDVINSARALESKGELEDAASLARSILESRPVWPPGAHLLLAKEAAKRSDEKTVFEESFLEYFGIGEFGPFHDEAQQLWAEVLQAGIGPSFDAIRAFFSAIMPVETGRFAVFRESRTRLHRLVASAEIDRAISLWGKPSISLTQLRLETLLELALQDAVDLRIVENELKQLVDQEGKFAPAYLQLARVALHRGDNQVAEAMWGKARSVGPMSEQVVQFEQLLRPWKMTMYSSKVSTSLLLWVERKSFASGAAGMFAKFLLPMVRILTSAWLDVLNPIRYILWKLRNRAALKEYKTNVEKTA